MAQPLRTQDDTQPTPRLSKLLVTTDFSPEALSAVEQAADLARRLSSELVLLYVVEDHLPPILIGVSETERRNILEEHRKRALEKLASYAAEHLEGCRAATAAVIGTASREILRYAEEHGHDLIVMASHGYGPLRQVLLGSTAERVLHHAPCPVMIVPSRRS
jgi:nucleotide-binding universal stress UspA family protein